MKKLFIIFIYILFLCSCSMNKEEQMPLSETDTTIEHVSNAIYRKISGDEANEIMLSAENFILLDVRIEEEYKEKRIDGAILIPDYEIVNRAESELPDKDALILIYCRSGRRSANAAKELVDMGYTNVYDFGGILDWTYETVSE